MFTKNKKIKVGVSVTIDNRMEVVVVDDEAKKVMDYRQVQMEYNFQTKELSDYVMFSSTLQGLFSEMNLNTKNIELTLTIPSIHFATTQLPAGIEGAAVDEALKAIAQESYLFKRHEPVTASQLYSSTNKDENFYVFSAIQESVVDQLKDAIMSIGVETFSINNPYGSVINGLQYIGKIDKQINSGEIWNFVQITNNGFTLFSMIGSKIREINDMPLPLKTFSPEEIYESMALSLQNNLSIYPAASLFVLSRTDLLSAETLLQRMDLRCEVDYLENNRFLTEQFIEIDENVDKDLSKIISIEAIGSAITNKNSPLTLSYFEPAKSKEEEIYGYFKFNGKDIPVNDTFITYCIFGIAGIIVILALAVFGITTMYNSQIEASINKLTSEKSNIESQIKKAEGETEGNVDTIIAEISKNNTASVAYFNALSTEIPQNLWLTYFYTDSNGAVDIQGDTADVGSIYDFFQGVKNSVQQSNIELSKLEYNDIDALLVPGGNGNKTLNFEISNSVYSNKMQMMASQVPSEQQENGENPNPSNPGQNPNNGGGNLPQPPTNNNDNGNDEGLPEPPQFNPPSK